MGNYRITVQYDGSRYKGWQVQKKEEATIQGKLQKVLESLTGDPVEVIGSGRTDAGVHALGQQASFHLEEDIALGPLLEAGLIGSGEAFELGLLRWMNRYLPQDIAVTEVKKVSGRFHARYNAASKTYRYRIHTSPIPDVFARNYTYTYTDLPLDIEAMKRAAEGLLGTHDFASFCGNRHMKKSTVRSIYSIEIREIRDEKDRQKEIVIDYTGDGFLQNMVRILTGTLIEVGSGRRDPESMGEILETKDRTAAGYTAPAQGLTLLKVDY